jgi:hypothetical protein
MKYWEITAELGVILMTASLAITSEAELPLATIDCTFYPVKFPKHRNYSSSKVASSDMVWLSSHDPVMPLNTTGPGLVVWDKNYRK